MAYKNLNLKEMAGLSRHWAGPARGVVMKLALGPALINDHEAFLASAAASAKPDDAVLAAADARSHAADQVFDRLVRGGYYTLTGLSELADDPVLAARFLQVRDRLFPGGLSMTQLSFLSESAAAEAVHHRLAQSDLDLLATIVLPGGGNLAQVVVAWAAAGVALREAEHEREALRLATGEVPSGMQLAARNRWLRAVYMLVASLDYAELSVPERNTLLAKLHEAEALAELRIRRGSRP